jgi:FtsH-binding integral membrane protein
MMAESSSDISSRLSGAVVNRDTASGVEAAAIDAGLRVHMLHIYNYMALGLAVTAIAAMGVYILSVTDDPAAAAKAVRNGTVNPARLAGNLYYTPAGHALFGGPFRWAVILAPLALAFAMSPFSTSSSTERVRPAVAQLLFWLYAVLIGFSLGAVFMIYAQTSVGRVFFVAAAAFIALSLSGYTTRRDLSGLGSFLTMGLFGIAITVLVNVVLAISTLQLASSTLQWVISVMVVIVFSGLTACNAQRLKNDYIYGAMDGEVSKQTAAILGALSLCLAFIYLFALLPLLLGVSGQQEE